MMDMRQPDQSIGHRPLDRAPVAGDQHVRAQIEQHAAKAMDVAQRVALADIHGRERDREIGAEPLAAGGVAVHGDNGMAPGAAELVGDGGEAHLLTAHGEGGEYMQQQRGRRRRQ